MEREAIAQIIAGVGWAVVTVLGVCLLVAAGSAALDAAAETLAYLDLPDDRRWRDAAVFGARAFALLGYSAAHMIFCCRPADGRAVAARAVFTAAAGTLAVLMVQSALNAPPSPGCGMKWLADLAPFLFATGIMVVETAAWVGWWAGRAERGAAPDPARTKGFGDM
jgi:hypothetical protein